MQNISHTVLYIFRQKYVAVQYVHTYEECSKKHRKKKAKKRKKKEEIKRVK